MGSNPTGAIMNTPALDQALTNQSIEIKDRVAELESLLAFYLGEGDSDTLHPVEAEYRKLASIEDNERTKEQTTELVRLARRMRYVSSRNIFDWADQVERLEKITDTTFDAGVYKGMEAAAKIKHPEPAGMRQGDPSWAAGWHRGVQDLRVSIRAEAKQLAGEADSRELAAPASPLLGSASPVLEMVRKLYDLAYHASRNAHQAWEHETSFEVCTTEVCINARETLEANANNAVHRDGGYSKE